MIIQKDQAELLCSFVEASRNTPDKEVFMASHPCMGETLGGVMHRGLPDRRVSVYIGDIEEMVDLGLLAVRYYGEHQLKPLSRIPLVSPHPCTCTNRLLVCLCKDCV